MFSVEGGVSMAEVCSSYVYLHTRSCMGSEWGHSLQFYGNWSYTFSNPSYSWRCGFAIAKMPSLLAETGGLPCLRLAAAEGCL